MPPSSPTDNHATATAIDHTNNQADKTHNVNPRRRLLTVVVEIIVAIAAFTTFTATSAAGRDSIETRVRDFSSAVPISVAVDEHVSPSGVGHLRPPNDQLVSATGVATNRATHELYKDGLREAMERPHVVDSELSVLMDELYRPGAQVGSGSTAAAVRAEAATGASVGGKLHTQKAADYSRALERWLAKNPTASPGDRAAAENVLRDMQNALGG